MEEERQTEVKNKEPVLLLPAKKEKKKNGVNREKNKEGRNKDLV